MGARARGLAVGAALLVALLAALLYAGTLGHPLVYDDHAVILDNPSIRDATNWRWVLGSGATRPLTAYTTALAWALAGPAPWSHHLFSIVFHIANVLLFFVLCGRALEDAGVPEERRLVAQVLAAGLLAAHPMATESVAYANARAGVLAVLFAQAAVLAFRRWVKTGGAVSLAGVVLAWLAAVASKESALVLPLVLFAYDRLLLGGARRRLLGVHLPLVAGTAAIGLWRVALLLRAQSGSVPTAGHAATQVVALVGYLRLYLFPIGQSVVHDVRPVASVLDARLLVALLVLAGLAVAVVRGRRRVPLVAFGALWFVLWLLPSSVFPLGEPLAEHRAYEASLGLYLAAAAGVALLPRRLAAVPAVALVLGCAAASWARARVWADPVSLFADAARKAPRAWQPHYALGDALRERDDCTDAVPEYARAAELAPGEARVHTNLGICLSAVGREDEAQAALELAMRLQPLDAAAWYNLGVLAEVRGRFDDARRDFARAIGINANHVAARRQLLHLDPKQRDVQCRELAALGETADECQP